MKIAQLIENNMVTIKKTVVQGYIQYQSTKQHPRLQLQKSLYMIRTTNPFKTIVL